MTQLYKFTKAYIACALWTDSDELGDNATIHDFSSETMQKIVAECAKFQADNSELLETVEHEQAGHDFWLTRNGHGAGFWARDLSEFGDLLTNACELFGAMELYLGDDGKIYC